VAVRVGAVVVAGPTTWTTTSRSDADGGWRRPGGPRT
jgi:hypothetical protein